MANEEQFDLAARSNEREAAPDLSGLGLQPYDPTEDRERKRGQIALSLIGLLAGIAVASLVFVMFAGTPERADAVKGVAEILFGPTVGLVGAVTGFYYGAKSID